MTAKGETEADFGDLGGYVSCTVVIRTSVLFLGGFHERSQISQFTPIGLIRIGTLPFPFYDGTCLVKGRELFLGFGLFGPKSCWSR